MAKITQVKAHLVASSPEELTMMQLKNNVAHGKHFKYGDGRLESDGKWYCWFYADVETDLPQKSLTEKVGKDKGKDEMLRGLSVHLRD